MAHGVDIVLRKIELFKLLKDEDLHHIARHLELKQYKAGEYLFIEFSRRNDLYMVYEGELELFNIMPFGEKKLLAYFGKHDFLGENALMDDLPHSTYARATVDSKLLILSKNSFNRLSEEYPDLAGKVMIQAARIISRRMLKTSTKAGNVAAQYHSGEVRIENDLLGSREVPAESYYGIQTLRALENFNISGIPLYFFPALIEALAAVKMAAAKANYDLGLLTEPVAQAIIQACSELIKGKYQSHFILDMIQGGAGTSTNMNANEVIANRALEIMGFERGDHKHCHPNNHVNLSQSTNDVYPTAVKIALVKANMELSRVLQTLVASFRAKGGEFNDVIKVGRTQLQDAVPMTLGQEFEAFAVTLEEEIERLDQNARLFLEVNMGATAIGTGINSDPDYSDKCVRYLREITGLDIVLAKNLIEATQDTGAFVMYSSAVKRLAVKLSKIANDLRLLSSGPRCGLNEINLPPMQPGSSIMPGKVNPVIPEVVNQVAFKVIGNDQTVTLGAEAGQLQLNVMQPVVVQSLFESIEMLKNAMNTFKYKCIDGITANEEHCREMVYSSIGLITALSSSLGYEKSSRLAKEALETGKRIYDLVLEKKLLSKEDLDTNLAPESMVAPKKNQPVDIES